MQVSKRKEPAINIATVRNQWFPSNLSYVTCLVNLCFGLAAVEAYCLIDSIPDGIICPLPVFLARSLDYKIQLLLERLWLPANTSYRTQIELFQRYRLQYLLITHVERSTRGRKRPPVKLIVIHLDCPLLRLLLIWSVPGTKLLVLD